MKIVITEGTLTRIRNEPNFGTLTVFNVSVDGMIKLELRQKFGSETQNDVTKVACFLVSGFHAIRECSGQTDGQTDSALEVYLYTTMRYIN